MIKRFLVILFLLFNTSVWCNNYCEDVFNRLVNSAGVVYGSRPVLSIVKSDVLIAETYSTGEIKVGSRLIDLCRRFGADSCNAMAHVLSHELAHFYLNHSWRNNFTSAYANVEWSSKLEDYEQKLLPTYETQADEMGFFYSLNAGYKSWKVASQVLDSIYTWYNLPKELPGYPPLSDRTLIAFLSAERVQAMIPLFRISNYFTVIAKYYSGEPQFVYYQSAGYCLDHLVHENIKTPNVLNNLGVILFLQAQPSFYQPMQKMMYPMMLDFNSSSMDMSEIVGTKGLTPSSGELSKETMDLLERSKTAFNEALKFNKQYVPANLNIALVHFILKEEGSMSDKIKFIKGLEIDMGGPSASILDQLEALHYYLKGDAKKMNDAFKKAINRGDVSAQWNNEVLSKTTSNINETMNPLKWTVDTMEMIFGKQVNAFFKSYKSSQETRLDPYHQQFILWTDKKKEGSIYTFRSLFSQTVYRDLLFFEVEDENFQTSHGVKLNSTKVEIEKMYGTPYYTSNSTSGYQYLYPSQSMIITIDYNTQEVVGITYYGVKK